MHCLETGFGYMSITVLFAFISKFITKNYDYRKINDYFGATVNSGNVGTFETRITFKPLEQILNNFGQYLSVIAWHFSSYSMKPIFRSNLPYKLVHIF